MKKTLILAALIISGLSLQAQTTNTNPPAQAASGFTLDAMLQNGIDNGGVYVTAGRKLTGDVNIVGFGYMYNMTQGTNAGAGLIAGYDQLIHKNVKHSNVVKGGLSLNAVVHPFASSYPNYAVQLFGAALIATPTGGSTGGTGVGTIVDTGIAIPIYTFKTHKLYLIPSYENRVQEGGFGGNYALLGLSVK